MTLEVMREVGASLPVVEAQKTDKAQLFSWAERLRIGVFGR